MDLRLSGQSIIVTGGSSGIGLETARLLLHEGAVVTICGRDPARLRTAQSELDSPNLNIVQADILDPQQAVGLVASAIDKAGRLDGVAAIAGRGRHGSLLELDHAEILDEISNKVLGFLNIVRPAIPELTKNAGRIVGLTAPTARQPIPTMGAIGLGRAALDNAISVLSLELAPSGIRVNAVGAGLIDTPRQEARHGKSERASRPYSEWLEQQAKERAVPLDRAGTATEVATAICWLLSPVSSYSTGGVLDVTGGLRSR